MTSYKSLYYLLVRSIDEALTDWSKENGLHAWMILHQALLQAEEAVTAQDIIPEEDLETNISL